MRDRTLAFRSARRGCRLILFLGSMLPVAVLAQGQGSQQPTDQAESAAPDTDAAEIGDERVARAGGVDRPYLRGDDTWVSISGTVDDVNADAFILNYGDGEIIVEMDDGDRDADAYQLVNGDNVTVEGIVDDDFFEIATIEASSVYVEKLDTVFHSSALDEEGRPNVLTFSSPAVRSAGMLVGTVVRVDETESSFTLNAGGGFLSVDVGEMPYDPLDEEGYQRIEVGDLVTVEGQVDRQFIEGRSLTAESVVTVADAGI